MYTRTVQGVWILNLPPDDAFFLDPTRAMLSAGADLMNQLQAVLDEVRGLRLDEVRGLRRDVQQLALFPQVVQAATPGEAPSRWIGEVPKTSDDMEHTEGYTVEPP